jgi:two-component system chemotaxis response regulator CheB
MPTIRRWRIRLLRAVKAMAEVKVIKRWAPARARPAPGAPQVLGVPASMPSDCKAVVIGASTGGPVVLQTILAALPLNFPVPLLIVQHIAPGFTLGMVDWLRQTTGHAISLAVHGEAIRAGHVYVAPDNQHMGVDAASRLWLRADAPENGLRPAVSVLFRSAAASFGTGCIGVLLTGMGRDGLKNCAPSKAAEP